VTPVCTLQRRKPRGVFDKAWVFEGCTVGTAICMGFGTCTVGTAIRRVFKSCTVGTAIRRVGSCKATQRIWGPLCDFCASRPCKGHPPGNSPCRRPWTAWWRWPPGRSRCPTAWRRRTPTACAAQAARRPSASHARNSNRVRAPSVAWGVAHRVAMRASPRRRSRPRCPAALVVPSALGLRPTFCRGLGRA
jgi:hypothetical protein